jgi:glycosyltransferase involved in cell wall biosynthesis
MTSASITALRTRRARSRPAVDVLFYVPAVFPLLRPGTSLPAGGAETQIVLVSKLLAALGMRVALAAYEEHPDGLPDEIDGVMIVPRPPYRRRPRPIRHYRELATLWRTLARVNAPVIVQRASGAETGLVALYARATRRRFVYSAANLVDFTPERVLTHRRELMLYRLGLRWADAVIAQTEEQRELCRQQFERDCALIRSVAETAERTDEAPQAFLWIGRVVWYKQPLAFVELARALPDIPFWMVGVPEPGPEGDELFVHLEAAVKTTPNLELLAPRPRGELGPLIRQAVAIVSTSEFEGLPNTLLEGWARGVPALVLSHDPDGLIERHQLGGFAAGSAERLAALTSQMWSERDELQDLGRRCREFVQREYAPATVAGQWQALLVGQAASRGGGHR